MFGKREMEVEGVDMEDNLEDDSAVDMEIVGKHMKLVPIPEVNFHEIDSDIFDGQDNCNGNEAELAIANDESAALVPTHQTMSDICPPDFSLWTAEDDLLLKNAVEAGAALEVLAKGAVRFSHRFAVRELRERWHALLYNPEISAKAAAGMVEVELSQMVLSKPTQSSKLKGKDEAVQKHKLHNVHNQYYQMRKRIDAERILPVEDISLFPKDTVVCTGNANEVVQEEGATMHEGLPFTVCMEGAVVAPPFGLSEDSLDIEDKAFSQMVSFLASGGLEGDAGTFSSTNMDSVEVNPAPMSLMSNGCYDFSRHDPSVMPSVTAVGSANEYISTENIHHLVEDIPQAIVHSAVTIHDNSYIVESSLSSDAITASTNHNEPTVNPVPVVNCNPDTFQGIDTRYVRAEGFGKAVSEQNISASGMLSQLSIRNWEGDVFLMPPMTVDIKDSVDEPILSTEYKGDTIGPREPVRDGHLMLSSLTTKEELLISSGLIESLGPKVQHEPHQQSTPDFLPNSSGGENLYALGDGQDMVCDSGYIISGNPMNDESHVRPSPCVGNMDLCCSNNSALEATVCVRSNGLEMAPIPAYTAPVPAKAGKDWSHNAIKSEVMPLNISANCEPLLFIHGPMDCTLNTEDINVPYNDEFNPLEYQEPPPISTVVLSSYVEQTTAWGSLSTEGNLGNQMSLCKGLTVVKEEPEAMETLVEAANELQPLASKDEEINKPSTDYQRVKMEMLEFTSPSVVCEEVSASKKDCYPGVPSSIVPTAFLPVALQQGILIGSSMLENCANSKFNLSSSHKSVQGPLHGNDGYTDFTRSLQVEVALPTAVQDNLMQVSQEASVEVGFNDFQVMSCEEVAVNQFPGNQEDKFSDSDEDLPHFSDVEAMYASICLLFHNWRAGHRYWIWAWNLVMMKPFLQGLVTIGRVTQENIVDIDLGKGGRTNKVSRRQATIKFKEDGLFYLENHGRRAIAVNRRDITSGQRIRLGSNYLIKVGGMKFIFEINKRLIKEQIEQILQARLHV